MAIGTSSDPSTMRLASSTSTAALAASGLPSLLTPLRAAASKPMWVQRVRSGGAFRLAQGDWAQRAKAMASDARP